ncbi:hypothetical protein [Jannaschia seosinensis]|nr:hypothetical protein [Jannaschia seosinensis]
METLYLVVGLVILLLTAWDLLTSTIGGSYRLSVSDNWGRVVFRGLRALSRLGGGSVLTEISGVVVMTALATAWIMGFWTGWTLILASADSVDLTRTGQEIEPLHVPGHVGHLLSTLGGATTQPTGVGWNLVNAVIGLNGMLALTLSVSFLFNTRTTLQSAQAFAALSSTGTAEPDALQGRLADVVAGLHMSPFALWYGHHRTDRQVPLALLNHARKACAAGGALRVRTEALMRDLPHWSDYDDGGDFLEVMARWTEGHRLHGGPELEATRSDARG